jgi:XTP/dITP diphosphohydrolase
VADTEPVDPAGSAGQDPLREFLDVMRQLRRECSWKAEQTHASLIPYLREEAHEVAEAIESGDPDHLREELGDLLLQVYFHAVLAEEAGQFTLDDVARGIVDKMRRRNPHVFGDLRGSALTPDEVDAVWQRVKAEEKSPG